jgi:hypothetical protein
MVLENNKSPEHNFWTKTMKNQINLAWLIATFLALALARPVNATNITDGYYGVNGHGRGDVIGGNELEEHSVSLIIDTLGA